MMDMIPRFFCIALLISSLALSSQIWASDSNKLFATMDMDDVNKVKELIAHGVDCEIENELGLTVLHWASLNGHKSVVEMIIIKGVNPDKVSRKGYKQTPLILAAQGGHIDIAEYLIKKGADMNTKDMFGRTPLSHSLEAGQLSMAKFLLNYGVNVNTKDDVSQTPLHIAVVKGNFEVVKLLVEKGADVNAKNELGMTPQDLAKQLGKLEIAKLLDQ